jgi:leucyl aminopeptidase
LVGSKAYAEFCAEMGYNIVAYFNNDMNGYLHPGNEIHIDLIYPDNVAPLGDYYMNLAGVYFPEMQVRHVTFTKGDSDHTSFNNKGFMGIYPFEDKDNPSPYMHTGNDIIGTSVNSFEQSQIFTQMNIASVATLASLSSENVFEKEYQCHNQEHDGRRDGNFALRPCRHAFFCCH